MKPFALVLAIVFALAVTGCGETTTKSTAEDPAAVATDDAASDAEAAAEDAATETTETVEPEPTPEPPPEPEVASFGDSITLAGQEDGESIRVKLLRVLDPAPLGEFDTADPGTRVVGIEIQLANEGTTTYSDSPGNGAKVISKGDRQFDTTILVGGPCSSDFGSSAKISPGGKRRGCIPFEVSKGVKLKTFQFTLASGFGDETAEFDLVRK